MGLSFAISAGIVMLLVIYVMLSIPGFVDEIITISDTAEKSLNLDKLVTDTSIDISSTSITQGSDMLNFNLENIGTEKLWRFDKFNLLVTYDANITDTKTKITEKLTYTESSIEQNIITFDSVSNRTGACIVCSFVHDVGASGTDKILVVGVSPSGSASVTSVSYNSQPLTKIRSDDDGGTTRSELWYMIDPPTGSNTVQVILTLFVNAAIGSISLNGISQTSPIDAHNGTNGNSAFPSVIITTNTDNSWNIDTLGTLNGPLTEGSDQIERWDLLSGATLRGGGSTNATTSSGPYTMSWTNDAGSNPYSISTVSLRPGTTQDRAWAINSITNDFQEPNILNPDETAEIVANLTYPLANSGVLSVILSTDNGVTATESVLGS